jgi:Na+/alanine symporter
MEAITEFVGTVNGIVWGIPMLILILGAGLFLTIGLRFFSIMKIPFGFSLLWKGRIPGDDAGDITPFNALMTSLSATIGTGNIAGVATAIFLGGPIIALSLAIFAFTTIIGWSYYSERSLQYLFGTGIIMPFRAVWSLAVIVGATIKLGFVWLLADTLNAMMAIPNLIALIVLSPVVFAITKEFFDTRGKSENNPF